jgi:hypothetical protein
LDVVTNPARVYNLVYNKYNIEEGGCKSRNALLRCLHCHAVISQIFPHASNGTNFTFVFSFVHAHLLFWFTYSHAVSVVKFKQQVMKLVGLVVEFKRSIILQYAVHIRQCAVLMRPAPILSDQLCPFHPAIATWSWFQSQSYSCLGFVCSLIGFCSNFHRL